MRNIPEETGKELVQFAMALAPTEKHANDLSLLELRVLKFLKEEGIVTVGNIIEHTGVLPAHMTRILDKLEQALLCTRKRNAIDRRKVDVELTTKGIAQIYNQTQRMLHQLLPFLQRLEPEVLLNTHTTLTAVRLGLEEQREVQNALEPKDQ